MLNEMHENSIIHRLNTSENYDKKFSSIRFESNFNELNFHSIVQLIVYCIFYSLTANYL